MRLALRCIVLCGVCCLFWLWSTADVIDDVDRMITEFETLSSTTADALIKPDSPEYKALVKLHDSMEHGFEKMQASFNLAAAVIVMEQAIGQYKSHISAPLRTFRDNFAKLNDPTRIKTPQFVEDFVYKCKHQTGPLSMLDWIIETVVEDCSFGPPNPEYAELLSRAYTVVHHIVIQLVSDPFQTDFDRRYFEESRSKIYFSLKHICDQTKAYKVLSELEAHFLNSSPEHYPTINLALDAINKKLVDMLLPDQTTWSEADGFSSDPENK
uniref:Secreted protein n=1 Tax=Ditylenchus dipsaci TaxID=166011 RepID=A0A915EQ40_9BILA